jgi:hypothetical protein
MAKTITNGQARRIAAEWQAPGNAYSALQHVGLITDTLTDEIAADMRTLGANAARRELAALLRWAEHHGPGKVTPWGAWDDTPAR